MKDIATIFEIVNHFRKQIPVDVEGLALALGIPVKKIALGPNISGAIKKIGPDKFMIGVNAEHSTTRQRFTIAHEIGHFVLHRHLIGDGITDNIAYRSDGDNPNPNIGAREETEANKFAANLLMPAESIIHLREEERLTEASQLARRLEVSPAAMEIRLGPLNEQLRLERQS
jgi:Zn-dependent peptidase ImmA (M78 family)